MNNDFKAKTFSNEIVPEVLVLNFGENETLLILLFDKINGKHFYSIEDVYYIACTILYHLYDSEGDINTGIKIMRYYSLDDTFIDKLQKTDVLNKNRYKIKNKNKIKKLFKDT